MVRYDPAHVDIQIGGDVDGNIVVGDNNFVVNTNHGTIVYQQAAPQVRARNFVSQPPRAIRGFLNRAAELQTLESWISAGETVLIHGPDGVGKSSLIRQVANSNIGRAMPHGVIFLEGASISEEVLGPNDVVQRLFDVFFESVPLLKVDVNTARPYLSNTRPLLLFDEVALSPALQNILPDLFPNGAMIFTADVVAGRGDFLRLPLGPLQREVAIRLLVNKSGLEHNPQNANTLDTLCELLGDISLAVVITGNVIRETGATLEETLAYLQKISRSQANGLDRAFAFVFSRLKPVEREILSAAAFTPGVSMSSEWLVAACGAQEAEHCIERLKALGLLAANSPRLRLPPGLRIPAQRSSILEEDIVLRRLSVFLLTSLELNAQNWGFFANELGNFFGALGWAIRNRHWTQALRLGLALDPYLTLRGYWDSWSDLLDVLLNAARESGNRAIEAFVLHQLGARAIGMGARQQALDYLYRALQIRAELGDALGMAYTQHNIDFLIGPPPPGDGQPQPQPPGPGAGADVLTLAAGGFGFLIILAIVALAIIGLWPDSSTPPPISTTVLTESPSYTPTGTPTGTPIHLPTFTPTNTNTLTSPPTNTSTYTPTPTPIPLFLTSNLAYSRLLDTAYLYQGINSDYFEVPVELSLSNIGSANIGAFQFSVYYEAFDGHHPARFRFDGQSLYFESWTENGLVIGQPLTRELRVMIPRSYQDTEVRISVQTNRCQIDIQCTINSLSYSLPLIVYDFIENAQFATWYGSGIGYREPLTFNGNVGSSGSVRLDPNLTLEDGFQPEYSLFTYPPARNNSGIVGDVYVGELQFVPGDRLFVRVGFLNNAGGDGVRFRLRCELAAVAPHPYQVVSLSRIQGSNPDLIWLDDWSDQILRGQNVQLPSWVISNTCRNFRIIVVTGPTANLDLAVWLSAYIARFRVNGLPPPPPTSTSQPGPTPTPTATPTPTVTRTPSPTPFGVPSVPTGCSLC